MTNPTALMLSHWRFNAEHGRPLKPIYALVSLGADQPAGYVKGWALKRRHMEARRVEEWTPDSWTVEQINPPAALGPPSA